MKGEESHGDAISQQLVMSWLDSLHGTFRLEYFMWKFLIRLLLEKLNNCRVSGSWHAREASLTRRCETKKLIFIRETSQSRVGFSFFTLIRLNGKTFFVVVKTQEWKINYEMFHFSEKFNGWSLRMPPIVIHRKHSFSNFPFALILIAQQTNQRPIDLTHARQTQLCKKGRNEIFLDLLIFFPSRLINKYFHY